MEPSHQDFHCLLMYVQIYLMLEVTRLYPKITQAGSFHFQKIFGVCIHPKYGGWFALRGVLIFKGVTCPELEKKEPIDCVPTFEKRKELLEMFNYHWRDWTFRDIIPAVKKYSEDQMEYFSTPPKDRRQLIDKLKQDKNEEMQKSV